MNKYKIYFEFMGKKMQYEISANSFQEAEDNLRHKIIIHKTSIISGIETNNDKNGNLDNLKDIFGMR